MKNKGKIRILAALFAVVLCMAAFPLTAYAGGGEDTEAEPPTETTTEPEAPATINPVSLTPDGNLTLVDDIDEQEGESLKQFITVVTKDGNYFYIVIDRVGDKENVYFLNMVDEADLLALIEDMDTATTQPVVTPQPEEPAPEPEPTTEPEPEPEKKGGGMGGILLIVLVQAAGGGAFYYFKILKPKQAVQGGTDLSELDELDFDVGDDYFDMADPAPESDGDEQEGEDE
jgi:flagellar basal body-associated protein FliL